MRQLWHVRLFDGIVLADMVKSRIGYLVPRWVNLGILRDSKAKEYGGD